ncbi:hypothetical protein evm_014857 [Chilo suppressalis]|nr:hypothetical protein evm_014857 [Chilo suppressalis]
MEIPDTAPRFSENLQPQTQNIVTTNNAPAPNSNGLIQGYPNHSAIVATNLSLTTTTTKNYTVSVAYR